MSKHLLSTILTLLVSTHTFAGYEELKADYDSFSITPPTHLEEGLKEFSSSSWGDDSTRGLIEGLKAESIKALDDQSMAPKFEENLLKRSEAESFLAKGGTVDELRALVASRNRSVRSQRERALAAIESISQVALLDEILSSYSVLTESLMNKVGPMKGSSPVEMTYPSPSVTSLKVSVAKNEASIERENYFATLRDKLFELEALHNELTLVREDKRLKEELLELLGSVESVATALYETGKSDFQDVISVRVKRLSLGEMVRSLEERDLALTTSILQLVDLTDSSVAINTPDKGALSASPDSWKNLLPDALISRQELRLIRAKIAKMEAMIEMGESMLTPSIDHGFSRFQDRPLAQVGSGAMAETFPTKENAAMGYASPKKPWYGASDSYLTELRIKLSAAKSSLAEAESKTASMLHEKWSVLDAAKRDFTLYDNEVVALRRSALDAGGAAYESGSLPFPKLIALYDAYLDAALSRAKSYSKYETTLAAIEKIVGAPISAISRER
ncbi:MAG: hypothetical protein C0608_11225 [Deltaproteobacteria bacterium]|nr:MAG: hypothetical protein C0608_11225 [Deltaproteobacteria bacterium]